MTPEVRIDRDTIEYFDQLAPVYSSERLEPALRAVRERAEPGSTLVDLGCGAGNTLEYLRDGAGLERVVGVDVSASYLARVEQRLGCETVHGSVLDSSLFVRIEENFDFAVIAAVLHHLIGRDRGESRAYAELAIQNAASIVRSGGHVVIHEPVYYPGWLMTGLFWVKKLMTRFTNRRVPIGGYWNNIGAPVVSYYTNEELVAMIERAGLELVDATIESNEMPRFMSRLIRKTSSTFVARKVT